jgi:hypothetical protein
LATADQIVAWIEKLEGVCTNAFARVSYEGHTIEYRSLAAIDRAIATLRAALASVGGTPSIRDIYVQQPDKGL